MIGIPPLQWLDNTLLYRKWEAEKCHAALLLVHGLGAHSARWHFFGDYFSQKGYPCYALELKGFGQTPERPRGHASSFSPYYADIDKLYSLMQQENPGSKIFIIGESMGALIAFLAANLKPLDFCGQVLLSPAFRNKMRFTFSSYLSFALHFLFNPLKSIAMPFSSAMCTSDQDYQEIMERNPDELRTASIHALLNILQAQKKARQAVRQIVTPTLFLLPGKDTIIDEKYNQKIFQLLSLKDKELIEYPDMLHALSIEKGRIKVFRDTLNWMEDLGKKKAHEGP